MLLDEIWKEVAPSFPTTDKDHEASAALLLSRIKDCLELRSVYADTLRSLGESLMSGINSSHSSKLSIQSSVTPDL